MSITINPKPSGHEGDVFHKFGKASLISHNRAKAWIDPVMLLSVIGLSVIGIFMVYSSTRGSDPSGYDTSWLTKQIFFVCLGVVAMLGAAFLNYSSLKKWSGPIYGAGLLALLVLFTPLGAERGGAQSWFEVGPFQLQPSEFAKIATILVLAAFLSRYRRWVGFSGLGSVLLIAAVPSVLILLQPDTGTTLVYGVITVIMLLVGGIRGRHLLLLGGILSIAAVLIISSGSLHDFQQERLDAIFGENSASVDSYNQSQAQIAIGNGGLTGQGFGNGSQTRGEYVPEQQTDFIFTVIGEELGFVGGSLTIILFALLMWRIWKIANITQDRFGRLVCMGVFAMILFQCFESIGMTLGIMPVTGIPMPFVSYGGSSMLTSFMAIGLVMSVAGHPPRMAGYDRI